MALLAYNVARALLTWRIAPLKQEDEVSARSPNFLPNWTRTQLWEAVLRRDVQGRTLARLRATVVDSQSNQVRVLCDDHSVALAFDRILSRAGLPPNQEVEAIGCQQAEGPRPSIS